MQPFDVQSIAIDAPSDAVFRLVADRFALPDWTHAFKRVDAVNAVLETPAGAVDGSSILCFVLLAHRFPRKRSRARSSSSEGFSETSCSA